MSAGRAVFIAAGAGTRRKGGLYCDERQPANKTYALAATTTSCTVNVSNTASSMHRLSPFAICRW